MLSNSSVDVKKWKQKFIYCIEHMYMHTIEMLCYPNSDTGVGHESGSKCQIFYFKYLEFADMNLKLETGVGIRHVTSQVKLCIILYLFYIFLRYRLA